MKLAGLTGGIASGKSTVAEMFIELGARLIDADVLARSVVEPGKPAYKDIVERFGEGVLKPDKTLDRDALAAVIFNDEQARQDLNRITHPRIGQELMKRVQDFTKQGAEVIIFDAALLLETPGLNAIKPVIVIVADEESKIKRLASRNALSREQALSRINSQWTDEQRAAKADYVIDNSQDLKSLKKRVEEVWEELAAKK